MQNTENIFSLNLMSIISLRNMYHVMESGIHEILFLSVLSKLYRIDA